jgi:hypothetical protein
VGGPFVVTHFTFIALTFKDRFASPRPRGNDGFLEAVRNK